MIYLDNSATTWPKPEIVYRAMDRFLREKGGNPGRGGHTMAVAAQEEIEKARTLVGRLINAPDINRIIFTLNCTDALNMALKGLLRPGDHVVTSSIGHNSLMRPLRKLEHTGVRITRLPPCSEEGFLSPKDIEEAIREDTKMVAITHASNVTGIIQPIEEYGAMIRKRNVIFLVDAAQSAGAIPIDVRSSFIDLLAFSGHKGLMGPPGTGVLFMSERAELDSFREGGTGTRAELEEQPDSIPSKFESGTPNTIGIAGVRAGLEFIFEKGIENLMVHTRELVGQLIEGLRRIPRVTIYGPGDMAMRASAVSINIEGAEPGEVGTILDQAFDIKVRPGLHCAPAAHRTIGTYPRGTVRLSPGNFNTPQDIDSAVSAIEKIAMSGM